MKLLISCSNEAEAAFAIAGGADIIDVKNPKEGALGASFPWIIKHIKEITFGNIELSCTVGDLPYLPGSISLAVLGAATTGVDYIKVGLSCTKTRETAINLLECAVKTAKDFNPAIKIVATGYADAEKTGSIHPLLIPEIADKANADVAMIDTEIKNGNSLFTLLKKNQIKNIVDNAHDRGLQAALAGSLKKDQLQDVYELNADIAGLRTAACTNQDRLNGQITRKAVHELTDIVQRLQTQTCTLH